MSYDTDQKFAPTSENGVTTTRGFRICGDRYEYDFGKLCTARGWAQLDTSQDASYYGTWANPHTRELFSFCEGDTTHQRADTDERYAALVRELADWNKRSGYWRGIDSGLGRNGTAIAQRFEALVLGDLLHPECREALVQ